jgi:hypothetical protein
LMVIILREARYKGPARLGVALGSSLTMLHVLEERASCSCFLGAHSSICLGIKMPWSQSGF